MLKIDIGKQLDEYKRSKASRDSLKKLLDCNDNKNPNELSLAFRMMCHLAMQAVNILENQETEDMTMVQNFFDKVHAIFRQFVDTVSFISGPIAYARLLPQPQICASVLASFGIPLQYSSYIMRNSFKPLYMMNRDEFD